MYYTKEKQDIQSIFLILSVSGWTPHAILCDLQADYLG